MLSNRPNDSAIREAFQRYYAGKVEHFIAFMDVLGFGDIVETGELDDVVHRISLALQSLEVAQHLGIYLHHQRKEGFGLAPEAKCLNAFSFSDTFVLSSRDASPTSLFQIVAGTAVLSQQLFAAQLPVRGAIARGEAAFVPGTSHLVGKGVIRAARLEKIQDWFGIMIDPRETCAELEKLPEFPLIKPLLVKYNVPLKSRHELPGPHQTINWRFNLKAERGTGSLLPHALNAEHQRKRQNTLECCRFLIQNNLAYGSLKTEKGEPIPVPWLSGMWIGQKPPGTPGNKHGDEY